jgi:hypothetical protein
MISSAANTLGRIQHTYPAPSSECSAFAGRRTAVTACRRISLPSANGDRFRHATQPTFTPSGTPVLFFSEAKTAALMNQLDYLHAYLHTLSLLLPKYYDYTRYIPVTGETHVQK